MKLGCKVKTALARDVYTLGAFRNLESPRFKPPCLVPAQGPHLAPAHVTSRVPPGLLSPSGIEWIVRGLLDLKQGPASSGSVPGNLWTRAFTAH